LPVKYRTTGEDRWHNGLTINLSPSSVEIEGALPPSRDESIVFVITLPTTAGCLTGRGRIVRTPAPHARPHHASFALAVADSRLERRSAALARLDALLQGC
jgi:hypothetical protein